MSALTPLKIDLVRSSFTSVMSARPELVEDFYARLFAVAPEVRPLFPKDITAQASKLETTLQIALNALETPEALVPPLHELGKTHARLGVKDEQYHIVNKVLMDTLAAQAGELWTDDVSSAWGAMLSFVAYTMIAGAHLPDLSKIDDLDAVYTLPYDLS